jgi:periplasmic protein TonB
MSLIANTALADTILPREKNRSAALLWLLAGVFIIAAHVLIALYFLLTREPETTGNAVPDAIMIELPPLPVAPPSEPKIETPPPEAEKPPPPPPPPESETEPEEIMTPPPEPLPLVPSIEPVPVLQAPELPPVLKAEVTLPPPPKPQQVQKPLPKKEVVKKDVVKRQVQKPDPRPQQQDQTERAQQAAQARAQAAAAASASAANWRSELYAHIQRYKRYPEAARSRGDSGTASVSFTLDGGGRVVSARLVSSSGSSVIDEEAVSTIQRASPMPAPPSGGSVSISVPMHYSLH